VGKSGALSRLGPTELQHHERLPRSERRIGSTDERRGIFDPLDERGDHSRRAIMCEELDEVTDVEVDLVAWCEEI